jgi:hypothetical protein
VKARLSKGAKVAEQMRQAFPIQPDALTVSPGRAVTYHNEPTRRQALPIVRKSNETICYGEGWSNAQHCRRAL